MAVVCPPQTLCDTFSADYDSELVEQSFYEPRDVKLEKVPGFTVDNLVNLMENQNATLLDLSSDKSYQFTFKQELSYEDTTQGDLLRWTQKHPHNWQPAEVLDWVHYIADYHQLDGSKLRGESYQKLDGAKMMCMTQEQFHQFDPEYGTMFYGLFRQLCSEGRFVEPAPIDYNADTDTATAFAELAGILQAQANVEDMEITQSLMSEQTDKMLDNNLMAMFDMSDGVPKVQIGETWYDFEVEDDLSKYDFPMTTVDNGDHGYGSGDSDVNSEWGNDHSRLASVSSDFYSDDESVLTSTPTKKKSVNRKRLASTSTDEGCEVEEKKSNRGRKQGQSSKGNHLWEFIRDLLKDTSFNPQLLRWEDKEAGVFRFVQSEAVAQMWGRKKNNPCMTYEKLSRAMRYYYKRGILDRVDGRRLVYKFGPNSHGWKD